MQQKIEQLTVIVLGPDNASRGVEHHLNIIRRQYPLAEPQQSKILMTDVSKGHELRSRYSNLEYLRLVGIDFIVFT